MGNEGDECDSLNLLTVASQTDVIAFLQTQAAKITGLNSNTSDDDDDDISICHSSLSRSTQISSKNLNNHKKSSLSHSCFASISNSSSQKQTISDDLTELKWLNTFKLKEYKDNKTNNNNNNNNLKEKIFQYINSNDDQISKLCHELKSYDDENLNINSLSFGVLIFLALYSKRYDKQTPWLLTLKQLYEYIQINIKQIINKRGWKDLLKQTLINIPCFIKTKRIILKSRSVWTIDPYYRPLLTRAYLSRLSLQINKTISTNQNDEKHIFLYTRGSVPCFWVQLPDLRYKPKVTLLTSKNHMNAFRQHFEEQEYYYGKQFLISLTNQHGAEGRLNAKYRELYETSENSYLKFEDFDFHKECAGMRYDRLTILLARLIADQDDYKYFALTKDGTSQVQQTGVFRTNCIDCLDRTNVVQTLLAKRMLEQQLQRYNIIKYNETIDSYKQLSHTFKNIWADNADTISFQYAGTGALKTDYTRTGQRSMMGLVQDGYNSCMRYILNNFFDGFRQDGIDLFLGNHQISSNEGRAPESCPISKEISKKLLALPVAMLIAFSMCIINLLIPAATFHEQVTHILFWGVTTILTLALTIFWRHELVDVPKLYSKVKYDPS
ncbi:unnamed protein product [Rotaria sp. Silwood1]|nr:unnamed protein product [Rotaria sp. Silwood1]